MRGLHGKLTRLGGDRVLALQSREQAAKRDRVVRDHDRLGDRDRTVGVGLVLRLPEILRRVLLADEEARFRHAPVGDEGQREGDRHFFPARQPRLARKVERRVGVQPRLRELSLVAARVVAGEDQHRKALALLQ